MTIEKRFRLCALMLMPKGKQITLEDVQEAVHQVSNIPIFRDKVVFERQTREIWVEVDTAAVVKQLEYLVGGTL